jgi:hypothetical protein
LQSHQNGEILQMLATGLFPHTPLVKCGKKVTGIISIHLHINWRPVAFQQLISTWQVCMENEYHFIK